MNRIDKSIRVQGNYLSEFYTWRSKNFKSVRYVQYGNKSVGIPAWIISTYYLFDRFHLMRSYE